MCICICIHLQNETFRCKRTLYFTRLKTTKINAKFIFVLFSNNKCIDLLFHSVYLSVLKTTQIYDCKENIQGKLQ